MPPRPAPRARLPRTRLSPEARRAQIVDVAGALFGRRPYAELGVADVAKAAGITQGLIYHYFPTKEALFLAAFERRARELLAASMADPALPLHVQVEQGVRGYLDFAEANRVVYLNVFYGPTSTDADFLRVVEETRLSIVEYFLATLAITDRAVRATRLSLRSYIGYAERATLDWLERRTIPRAQLERLIASALRSALLTGLTIDRVVPEAMGSLAAFDAVFKRHFALP